MTDAWCCAGAAASRGERCEPACTRYKPSQRQMELDAMHEVIDAARVVADDDPVLACDEYPETDLAWQHGRDALQTLREAVRKYDDGDWRTQ